MIWKWSLQCERFVNMFHSHWLLRSLPFHFVLGIVLNKTCCNQIALCFSLSSFIPICILQELSAFFVRFFVREDCWSPVCNVNCLLPLAERSPTRRDVVDFISGEIVFCRSDRIDSLYWNLKLIVFTRLLILFASCFLTDCTSIFGWIKYFSDSKNAPKTLWWSFLSKLCPYFVLMSGYSMNWILSSVYTSQESRF